MKKTKLTIITLGAISVVSLLLNSYFITTKEYIPIQGRFIASYWIYIFVAISIINLVITTLCAREKNEK